MDDLPHGKGWLYEPKYDGFRSRSGIRWTPCSPANYEDEATGTIDSPNAAEIAKLLEQMKGGSGFTVVRQAIEAGGQGSAEDGSPRSNPRGRTQRRPHQRRSVPAWLPADPVAHRQGGASAQPIADIAKAAIACLLDRMSGSRGTCTAP